MALTDAQIMEFKKEEVEAENFYDLVELADKLSHVGEKEWAKKIYKKSEGKAKNRNQIDWLAESLCANLEDNEWAERVQSEGQDLPDEEDQEYEEDDYDE